jgi:hypothetical protein
MDIEIRIGIRSLDLGPIRTNACLGVFFAQLCSSKYEHQLH